MRNLSTICGLVAAVAFVGAAPSAVADEVAKNACQGIGRSPPEKVGDRDGHAIDIVSASCRVESGPLQGGIVTAQYIWEWDKTNARMIFGGGVVRKADAIVVYQYTAGDIALVMQDGKVTGYTSSGTGRWAVASGSAAALAGKSFTWASKPTGDGQYETVWTTE